MTDAHKERRIRARVTNEYVQYVHNDLSDAAYFLWQKIKADAPEQQDKGPLYVDTMALLMLVSFTLEGYANFIGEHVIRRADRGHVGKLAYEAFERRSVRDKIKDILRMVDGTVDWSKRPFVTVDRLVRLRNLLAHPKAVRPAMRSYIAEGTESELKKQLREYRPDHAKDIRPEFAIVAYDDVQSIWRELLTLSAIGEFESWDGGSQGLEFIEHLDQ